MKKRGQVVAGTKKQEKQSAYDILQTAIDGGAKVLKPLFITNAYAAESFFAVYCNADLLGQCNPSKSHNCLTLRNDSLQNALMSKAHKCS